MHCCQPGLPGTHHGDPEGHGQDVGNVQANCSDRGDGCEDHGGLEHRQAQDEGLARGAGGKER